MESEHGSKHPFYLVVGSDKRGGTGKKYSDYEEALESAKAYTVDKGAPYYVCAPITKVEVEQPPLKVTSI